MIYSAPRGIKETTFIVQGVVLDLTTEEEHKLRTDENVIILPEGERAEK